MRVENSNGRFSSEVLSHDKFASRHSSIFISGLNGILFNHFLCECVTSIALEHLWHNSFIWLSPVAEGTLVSWELMIRWSVAKRSLPVFLLNLRLLSLNIAIVNEVGDGTVSSSKSDASLGVTQERSNSNGCVLH